MKNSLPVEGHSNLQRDKISGAIVNNSPTDYDTFMKQHEIKRKNKLKVESMQDDIINIKSEMDEIKKLLMNILEKI